MKTFDTGALVRCTGTFTARETGELIDPDCVKFRFKEPGAAAATEYTYAVDPELVRDSTGIYHVDLDAAVPGIWYVKFFSTGAGQAALEKSFFVAKGHL